MLDPKKRAEFDQARQTMLEVLPSLCFQLYQEFQKEGFTKEEAWELVKVYLANFGRSNG